MSNAAKDPYVGTRIREYEILDVIGKGGMGAIYRARHIYLDEERAIKVVHSDFADDKAFVQRFIREAKMLVKLRHPNLVQLYEFGTIGEDIFFMVLELIRGESLLDRVHRIGQVPIDDSVKIIREAARGLHAAHQQEIVHRDISPDNLLLVKDEQGQEISKVIDFGIAKPLQDQTRIFTRTNMFLGKPEFCSPEQCGALNEGEVIDHRSDVYSLGVTLYYALTGKLPFFSPTPQGYLLKHKNEPPIPIASHFPEGTFPKSLEKIILKTLAKKREERYATMEDLVRALDDFIGSSKRLLLKTESSEAISAEETLPSGFVFEGRYLIEKMLRRGANGMLYKAVDRILDVPVVLRIVPKELLPDDKSVARFKRGVVLSHKISHPNVCRIYDVGESDLGLYVSTQHVNGKLLSDMIQSDGRLKLEVGFVILKDVLSALNEAHRAGVIHRNLKPQSVVIDNDNRAHILDFATSILQAGAASETDPRLFFGTPSYMAPEQFSDKAIDSRADVYSVGVMMYEMFTGRLPLSATSVASLILAHESSMPQKPSQLNPGIHTDLDRIIMKAIEKDVNQRYQSVAEMLGDIESVAGRIMADIDKEQKRQHKFRELFERGKDYYDKLMLEEAIEAWREAQALNPQDAMVHRCLVAAENRLNKENQIRAEIAALFSQCEKLIAARKFNEARKVLKQCEDLLTASHRFRILRDQISIYNKSIDSAAK